MKTSSLVLSVLLAGCAVGDGRGYGTVDGTIIVTYAGDKSVGGVTIEYVAVLVREVQLEEVTALEGGLTQTRLSAMPVGQEWDALQPALQKVFGPVEVDRGSYGALGAVFHSVDIGGKWADGKAFHIKAEPHEGIRVSSPLSQAIAFGRGKNPNVHLAVSLQIPASAMAGVTPEMDNEAAGALLADNIAKGGVIQASWPAPEAD